jgi:lipoprotein LprG
MLLPRRLAAALLASGLTVGLLAGCTGDDPDQAAADEPTPEQVLAEAKATLDETSGLRLDLTTDDLPQGVAGITSASGVATTSPAAFDGTISVVLAGQGVEVPVIAVDDRVHAQIPFTTGWSDVDPADYGAPDPAQLVHSDHGFSSLLAVTDDLQEGESVRGGTDNSEVLTEYTGTVPGSEMERVIPSASGDSFDAAYQVTDDGELRQAVFTGVFYPGSAPMTYTVDFSDYGSSPEITAP